ncbi:MAG: thiamine pyrophosphate-binding protein, partial [Candidatus Methylomirabilota bacterium]
MSRMTGARFIAESLQSYGVTHVFFMEAILRKSLMEMDSLGIARVLTHSEKAAAYMADGYARAGRKPGVCMAQSVGAANLASGLQEPFLGHAPVVALTGRAALAGEHRHAYQEVRHAPLFAAVTKSSAAVTTLEQLPRLLRQAFRDATTGMPGPAHLDLLGHQAQTIESPEADLAVVAEAAYSRIPPHRPAPEVAAVRLAARALLQAERPVIVAGGGVTASSAGPELTAVAERLQIPVVTSLNGKESLLDSHPLNIGLVGRYSRWCANRLVSEADLVFYVGSTAGEHTTNGWRIPAPRTPTIQIDIDPAELGRSYPTLAGIAGDAKVALAMLLGELPARPASIWTARAQQLLADWRRELEPLRTSDATPIRPERLCKELTDTLPPNAILVADTGYSAIWAGTMVHLTHPDQRFLRCAGSLGWGFPGALGAKCGAPDRPVICLTGDGGFWYHLSELETARRCGIATVTVVNNNAALGQCLGPVRKMYGDRAGHPEALYRFQSVDFARIAEEMGCFGIRVEKPAEIA